jgi:hypothetical protein
MEANEAVFLQVNDPAETKKAERTGMGYEITIIDTSAPEAIAKAIQEVNRTPGLRIEPGIKALWALYRAPGHQLARSELEKSFGALDLHFGWFCRRVAERLGANEPDAFALVDYAADEAGEKVLRLKASVVAALVPRKVA